MFTFLKSLNFGKIYIAIGSMLLGILFVDSYGAIVKSLGDSYSTIQLTVFRNTFAIIPLLLLFLFSKENLNVFKDLSKKFIFLCFIRGICFTAMHLFYFIAITNMNFATASTLTFSAPFFIAILSIFFLGEKIGLYRWSAIIIGFLGVIMIMRPTTDLFSLYSIFPILVAFCWALAMIVLKFIPDYCSTAKIQFYSLIFSILGSLALFIFTSGHSEIKNYDHFLLMVLTGILGGTAAILFIYAYRLVTPSKLASFEYLGIPSSFVLGWIFFNEAPLNQLFPGVVGIVLAGMIIIWRESKLQKISEGSKKFY